MTIDKKLLEILCDPVTKVPVTPLPESKLKRLNSAIEGGGIKYVNGDAVSEPLPAALITEDGKVIYRIDDDIPIMLAESGIGTAQLKDW